LNEATWKPGECLALARHGCVFCLGLGFRLAKPGVPCNCVLRAVFRACYGRFRRATEKEPRLSTLKWRVTRAQPHCGTKHPWGYREQEFAIDFLNIARRTLAGDTLAWKIFRFHFLLGADCSLCTRKLGINRGEFFHEIYRIQQKLGKAYRETKPYSLFPVDEYFAHVVRGAKRSPSLDEVPFSSSICDGATERPGQPLRAPLAKTA
jgi:hypothetical protein